MPMPRYSLEQGTSRLIRNAYFTNSNAYAHFGRYGNQQDCDALGLGFSFSKGACYFPCPDAYLIKDGDMSKCEPRPILTKAEIYYEEMSKAVKDCAKLIPAYKDLVAEHNNDPTQVGFPADSGCENPFPSPPQFPFDPVGQYDNNASNGDPLKPKDAPTDDLNPTNPPPSPILDDKDPSGISKNLPRDRILITAEEIDQLPKVNDFGVSSDSGLALQLRYHPTYLDVNPSYLLEFQEKVPSFQWEITITQEEYALLPEDLQCAVALNYGELYSNPSGISELRLYAPTITMTRNAPSTFPVFKAPRTKRMLECEAYNVEPPTYQEYIAELSQPSTVGGNVVDKLANFTPLSEEEYNKIRDNEEALNLQGKGQFKNAQWVGNCATGYCKQPPASPPEAPLPTSADTGSGTSTLFLIGGGVVLIGIAYSIIAS